MKVIIIGDRAIGKTSLGRAVAERLGWPFHDVDAGITDITNMSHVEAWQTMGVPAFRRIEHGVLAGFLRDDPCVISSSAGASVESQNAAMFAEEGLFVVYLNASIELLWERLRADAETTGHQRPVQSTGGIEEVAELYEKRHPVNSGFADLALDAALPLEELVEQVVAAVATT